MKKPTAPVLWVVFIQRPGRTLEHYTYTNARNARLNAEDFRGLFKPSEEFVSSPVRYGPSKRARKVRK